MTEFESELSAMRASILDGNAADSRRLAEQALTDEIPPLVAIEGGFVLGIHEVGTLFEDGEYFLPELVMAAEALKAAMSVLHPALGESAEHSSKGRVVIGTVVGDIHDIGMMLVGTMLAANGFEISSVGSDSTADRFISRAHEIDADLVCASALLTTTMVGQSELARSLSNSGLRAKLMVGGAPVSQDWADEIGAHGFAANAMNAVKVAEDLLSV